MIELVLRRYILRLVPTNPWRSAEIRHHDDSKDKPTGRSLLSKMSTWSWKIPFGPPIVAFASRIGVLLLLVLLRSSGSPLQLSCPVSGGSPVVPLILLELLFHPLLLACFRPDVSLPENFSRSSFASCP